MLATGFAAQQSSLCEPKARPRVLGLGTAGVDYVAMVESYPNPDDKIRAITAFRNGGGNVANTLTALSRLGVDGELVTKIGQDEVGDFVMSELALEDRVTTARVLRSPSTSTAFTFVIVSKLDKTRTCIHTPQREELTAEEASSVTTVKDFAVVHLDSRHTHAALTLARMANSEGVPVSIDAEKNRPPYFDQLLPLCSIIFTNERFPDLYFPNSTSDKKITQLFETTRAEIIVTSLGSRGSVLYSRRRPKASQAAPSISTQPMSEISARLQQVCSVQGKLKVTSSQDYEGGYDVLVCPAWHLTDDEVVDTTGAGDTFIGGFLAAHVHHLPLEQCLQFGTICAALKIKQPGTRRGMPTAKDVDAFLRGL